MTERPYAGKLAAERQADRRERLIAAGLDLIGTEGMAGTTVRAICQRAGLSTRYFYESFDSLDALLLAVFDAIMERTVERMLPALESADGSLRTLLEGLGSAFIEMTVDEPRAMRIGFIEAWNSEALMRHRVQTLHNCAHLLAAAVIARSPGDPDEQAVATAAFMVVGGLLESILGWIDGSLNLDRDALLRNFATVAEAALTAASATTRSPR
ncbi:TetR/AcrR family transcriptional regulator [Nocardia nepalensis]|uniref:TetR/AcrR family transcriptional regulator n=1 Tax=Nocardia nepalensis TaxID=3375448 RepID=UPI003B684671